jgi:uncharacterized protein YehS (DUF1456 family)
LTNNDILRRLRYTFNFNDQKMINIFASANSTVTREEVSNWLKKEEDPAHVNCPDVTLAIFLNGLINEKRGKKEGPQPQPEKRINNNIILTKLKIALNLKAEDILEIVKDEEFNFSKSELSAFFRKQGHKHYKVCKDQFLRNFIRGLDNKYHVNRPEKYKTKQTTDTKTAEHLPENVKKDYNSAKPNASKIYVNPKATKKAQPERKVLKLSSKDIWGE